MPRCCRPSETDEYGPRAGADPTMVELFDLEWRLSQIDQHTRRFSAPHMGKADDKIAFVGLLDELDRRPWWPTTPTHRPRR